MSRIDRRSFMVLGGISAAKLLCSRAAAQTSRAMDDPRSLHIFPVAMYGAHGDGVTKDTTFLQAAIDAAAKVGGGMVVLEPGRTYLSGTLVLRSHVELHLAGGSTLVASPDRSDYYAKGSLLFAMGEENVCVSGAGTIDGDFPVFFPPKGPDGYPVPQPFLGPYDPLYPATNLNPEDGRPRMILLIGCRRTQLRDFTIRRSPTWTIHPIGCDDLHIGSISILNDLDVPNCDGIDIDHCRNVRVEGCNIVAGDDCLILKASRNFGEYGPCEGVTITNCTLESSSAGIKIETEGAFPLRSAVISNCTIVRSNRGISFLNRDGATVEDLLFTSMTIETRMRPMMWWGSGEPIALSSVPRIHGGPAGVVRNIQFVDMECRGESGIYVRGAANDPLRDIAFRGIDLRLEKTTPIAGGFYDMRPGDLFGDSGLDRRATAGFFAANVAGLTLDGVHVSWGANTPAYYGSAVELHDCSDVSASQVSGSAAHAGTPVTVLDKVSMAEPLLQAAQRSALP